MALHKAATQGNFSEVETHSQTPFALNKFIDDKTPLMCAAENYNLDIVKLLLAHELTQPTLMNKLGKNALYYAVNAINKAQFPAYSLRAGTFVCISRSKLVEAQKDKKIIFEIVEILRKIPGMSMDFEFNLNDQMFSLDDYLVEMRKVYNQGS